MSLPDDLNMPDWQRRRNAQRFGGGGLAPAPQPLSDDMSMDVWQQARAQQVAGNLFAGGASDDALAGGAGVDRVKALPAARAFNVDRDFLAQVEGSESKMYLPLDGNGRVVGHSGPTIGAGADFGQKDVAYLKGLGLSPATIGRLSPYLGKRGEAAAAFVKANPLELSAAELQALNGPVQDRELRELATKFDTASQVGPFHKLPRDTQTAIASLYFQYGTAAPAKRTPNYWRQITTGDWEGAYSNLLDFKDRHGDRRRAEAERLRNDIRSGKLPRRTQTRPGA